MVIVVFQFSTKPNMSDEYFKEVELLKKELENEKGFISAKRYKSNRFWKLAFNRQVISFIIDY